MNTIKKTDFLSSLLNDELRSFAELIMENKGTIIHSVYKSFTDQPSTYFHYTFDGIHYGYVQKSYFAGYDLSSEYKPSKQNGTGARFLSGKVALTLADFEKAVFVSFGPVKHYADLNEYLSGTFSDSQYLVK